MAITCVTYSGRLSRTTLNIDEAVSLVTEKPELHLFVEHTFSCYEDCSLMVCLGSLCPNMEEK